MHDRSVNAARKIMTALAIGTFVLMFGTEQSRRLLILDYLRPATSGLIRVSVCYHGTCTACVQIRPLGMAEFHQLQKEATCRHFHSHPTRRIGFEPRDWAADPGTSNEPRWTQGYAGQILPRTQNVFVTTFSRAEPAHESGVTTIQRLVDGNQLSQSLCAHLAFPR